MGELTTIETPDNYLLNDKGVYKQNGSDKVHISGPLWVKAKTEDINTNVHGVVVNFIDEKGRTKEKAFPKSIIHEQNTSLVTILANEGLMVVPNKEKLVKEYIGLFQTDTWMESVSTVGWLDLPQGELAFLFPSNSEVIPEAKGKNIIYQPEQFSPSIESIVSKGTLEEWQKNVALPCQGNPVFIAALCMPAAAILLKHSGLSNAGFHFYGETSSGKTTAAQIAASGIGNGADPADTPDRSYMQKWNNTANALEGLLFGFNDCPLIMDEIQSFSGKDFGQTIHAMTSGRSKNRMSKYTTLQPTKSWRTLIMSTGEISVKHKIEDENKAVFGGMSVRFIDIPISKGIVLQPHGEPPNEFVMKLKRNCSKYYGTAIPELIRQITAEYDNAYSLQATIRSTVDSIAKSLTPAKAESAHRRALNHFSLLQFAGELMVKLGIIPLSADDIRSAVRWLIDEWWINNINISESRRGTEEVKAFMVKHRTRFAHEHTGFEPVKDQAGYIKNAAAGKPELYLFTKHGLQEACGAYDPNQVLKEIDKQGHLLRNNGHKKISKIKIKDGDDDRQSVYAIYASLLSAENEGDKGDTGDNLC